MKSSPIKFLAGGGLVDRRSLLIAGVSFLSASSIQPLFASESTASPNSTSPSSTSKSNGDKKIGDDFPDWSKSLGRGDVTYGKPSKYEADVQRKLQLPSAPENSGSTAWLTPLEKMQGILTPNGLHFGSHHFGIPDIDPARHEFIIHGLVDRPQKFTLEKLLRYPMVSKIRFIECSGNTAANALSPSALDQSCQDLFGLISCSEWVGIPLSLLLNEAGIKKNARWVIVEGADGGSHSRSVPLLKLMDDAIIAFYQNGERLRTEQGYPMRLLMPGWEGNVSIKYFSRMEVADAPSFTGHESGLYTEHLAEDKVEGFSYPMDVKSVITRPSGKQKMEEKGFYEISGLSWSGYGKISKVEVSADEGKSWAVAQLQEPVIEKALTRFSIPWLWNGKSTVLLSRATDEKGRVQPTRENWKSRYASPTLNHYNAIQNWEIAGSGVIENVYL